MTASVTIENMASWDPPAWAERAELANAVYPPEESAEWPGRLIEWSRPEWGVSVRDERGRLVSYAGLFLRHGAHDGRSVLIGGVGGVMTNPDHRGRGHARAALTAAREFFAEKTAAFGLLVCENGLIPYYERLRWEVFEGELLTLQQGESAVFSFNRVMVTGVTGMAPRGGVIELNGRPW